MKPIIRQATLYFMAILMCLQMDVAWSEYQAAKKLEPQTNIEQTIDAPTGNSIEQHSSLPIPVNNKPLTDSVYIPRRFGGAVSPLSVNSPIQANITGGATAYAKYSACIPYSRYDLAERSERNVQQLLDIQVLQREAQVNRYLEDIVIPNQLKLKLG